MISRRSPANLESPVHPIHTHTRTGEGMSKTIITVVGKDTVGIIAKVCTYLAENQVNVEDISQTIVQGYFNMMMIVDTSGSSKPYAGMVTELDELGDEIGVKIRCQREDIFTKMHRI
jgi:ACT domain-containing protein